MIMVGYAAEKSHSTYQMYNPRTRLIVETRDVHWSNWKPATGSLSSEDCTGDNNGKSMDIDLDVDEPMPNSPVQIPQVPVLVPAPNLLPVPALNPNPQGVLQGPRSSLSVTPQHQVPQ